jgi:L,D-peptidoglycan transpeptidase YkuD (ErfK/YbiS/YcfS/YnhG family)
VKLALVAAIAIVAGCKSHDEPVAAMRKGPLLMAAHRRSLDERPQLVTAIIDDWSSTKATLRLWQRDGASWKPVGDAWPAVIGAGGAAWGNGAHGDGAPAGRSGPTKREGDRKSPAGIYDLRAAYGYAATPPAGAKLPYTAVGKSWECVDDPLSKHYAQILDRSTIAKADWMSSEMMKRDDALYTWVIDVAHNPLRVSGNGSCIFLHEWSGPDSATVGCTAMAEPQLAQLVTSLEPGAAFVLLPRADYAALAPAWGLPPL